MVNRKPTAKLPALQTKKEPLMKTILHNRIRCNLCGDVVESTSTHEYVQCSCGNCAADGGLSYLRRTFREGRDSYTELSQWLEEAEDPSTEG